MASTETAAGRNERLSDAERQVLRDSVRGFLASRWPASQAVAQSTDTQAVAALWHDMSARWWEPSTTDGTSSPTRWRRTPLYEAAVSKVFSSELQERLGQAALDILGTGGLLSEDVPSAPVGEMEQVLRHSIMGMIGGGTNEIQRTLIALRGLGLPR